MWIIDRFEGDLAVVECEGVTFDIPKKVLPDGAKAGDVLDVGINSLKTDERRHKVNSLMNKLFGENR